MHTLELDISPDYTVTLEFLWFGLVAHTTLHTRYTKHVKWEYRRDLEQIAKTFRSPLYAFQGPSCDPLKRKFILSLGFRFDHFRLSVTGEKLEMFRFRSLD